MKRILLLLAVAATACAGPAPLAPARANGPDVIDITYAINIPNPVTVQALVAQFPNGVRTPPTEAQRVWNYTANYGGTPNVYFGAMAPPLGTYVGVGIVVAPLAIASKEHFQASEWPDAYGQSRPNTAYEWLGRFVYTAFGER